MPGAVPACGERGSCTSAAPAGMAFGCWALTLGCDAGTMMGAGAPAAGDLSWFAIGGIGAPLVCGAAALGVDGCVGGG